MGRWFGWPQWRKIAYILWCNNTRMVISSVIAREIHTCLLVSDISICRGAMFELRLQVHPCYFGSAFTFLMARRQSSVAVRLPDP